MKRSRARVAGPKKGNAGLYTKSKLFCGRPLVIGTSGAAALQACRFTRTCVDIQEMMTIRSGATMHERLVHGLLAYFSNGLL